MEMSGWFWGVAEMFDQGRQLRDVLRFRQCRGLNGAGERANWQPCATLKTGVWLASACVSISLFRSLSFWVSCCLFWMALVLSLLVPANNPEMKKASSNQVVVHPNPFDGIGLALHCLLDFWDFGPNYNLALLVNTVWICICFLTSSCHFCLCSIYFPSVSCSKSCHHLKRSRY